MNANNKIELASTELSPDRWQVRLSVPSMHCGGCMSKVEAALMRLDEVSAARVNLTRKFVDVVWSGPTAPNLLGAVSSVGHEAHVQEGVETVGDNGTSELIRAVAVAGFATSNIMLMSAAIWAGAGDQLKDLFHWVSAAIALPTLIYSGRIFFRSAWSALRNFTTNMDVPISIGVVLAFSMSLYDTVNGTGAVYFEASVMLLFFLLIGRALDHAMRTKAQSALDGMSKLIPMGATVFKDEATFFVSLDEIQVGQTLLVAAGERVPLDGRILSGKSSLDCAIVTGENVPHLAQTGSTVLAGTLNLDGDLKVAVTANSTQSFVSQTVEMMANAASSRTPHRKIADRASQLYAPFVHTMALIAFVIWMTLTGDWHQSLTIAIAVLIITCPCALGLAVPIVQVIAAQRLFAQGVLTRDGAALERMQDIDTIVFDKTGTLTEGRPILQNQAEVDSNNLSLAATMAASSPHPFSQALVKAAGDASESLLDATMSGEHIGLGLELDIKGKKYRLGKPEWALSQVASNQSENPHSTVILSCNGEMLETFTFEDKIRESAKPALEKLLEKNATISLLSGDSKAPVQRIANYLNIKKYAARAMPANKSAELERLSQRGHKVLMVGDGLNDAPALAAAHVSMAPSTAADIGRNSADFVFLNGDLTTIPRTIDTTKRAGRLVKQNLALAVIYNFITIPFAMLGFVTPLVAAIAMSTSSIVVVLNASRLNSESMFRRSSKGELE